MNKKERIRKIILKLAKKIKEVNLNVKGTGIHSNN